MAGGVQPPAAPVPGYGLPGQQFLPHPEAGNGLGLWAPADLESVITSGPAPDGVPPVAEPVSWPDAIEVDRVVPRSGNMAVGPQQFWLGTGKAGQTVRFWIDTTTVHLSIAGWRIKTVPSRLSATSMRVIDQLGELITTIPRSSTGEISRFKAYGASRPR